MSEQQGDLRLRFSGRRFHGKRLPVSVLSDIEAFRDLLAAFAKAEWLASHEGRRRVPRGFSGDLNLDLVAIEEGSAVVVLAPHPSGGEAFLPGMSADGLRCFGGAYARIAEMFDTAAQDPSYRPLLKRDEISALNRFGAGLRPDEQIDLVGSKDAHGAVVSINAHARRDLITRIRDTYEKRYEGIGRLKIVSADGWIAVATEHHGVVRLEVAERAMAEFDGYLMNEVSFDISLELDAEDKVRAVKDIHAVDLHDAPNEAHIPSLAHAAERLTEIAALPDGWLDGEGVRVGQPIIDIAETLLRENPDWFAPAGIFPTPEGGIQIELSQGQTDFTISIDETGDLSGYLVDEDGTVRELPDRGAVIQAIGATGDR